MEDILASIRSMIADDEAAPELAAPPPETPPKAMPKPEVETVPVAPDAMAMEDVSVDLVADAASSPVSVESVASTMGDFELASTDKLDLDSLFSDEDLTIEPMPLDVVTPDPVDEVAVDSVVEAPASSTLPGTEDIDLVKSLMEELSTAPETDIVADAETVADEVVTLTDDIDAGTVELESETSLEEVLELDETWFSGDLSIPEGFDEVAPTVTTSATSEAVGPSDAPLVTTSEDASSMLDDILESTIASEEALKASEVETDATETSNVVSLAAIAARAEDDAEELEAASVATDYPAPPAETVPDVDTPAEVETPEDIVAELLSEEPDSEPEPDPEPAPQPAPESQADRIQALEEEVMARTAPLEEMIDDEVEIEAHNAFAELNKLVEEKAVVEERGPRIGDLVQEALKPMLKEWLDENLKGIVERAVTKEVKRISSGK